MLYNPSQLFRSVLQPPGISFLALTVFVSHRSHLRRLVLSRLVSLSMPTAIQRSFILSSLAKQ